MNLIPVPYLTSPRGVIWNQCCVSGSVLDPYSEASWIRIRIRNTDPDLDPNWAEILDPDPDPKSMYLDPQHCFERGVLAPD